MIKTRIAVIIAIAVLGIIVNSAAVAIPTAHSASDAQPSGDAKQSQTADENKKQTDEKQLQTEEKQLQTEEKQLQTDVTKLQFDEKQIQFDMTPPQTLVQSGVPQNPSIQESLTKSKEQKQQEQLHVQQLQSDTAKLQSDTAKLQSDENKFATHTIAQTFCLQGGLGATKQTC